MSSATTMRPRPPTTTRQRAPSLAEQLGRAIEALRSEDIEAAEPLLNAILQQWPAEPNAQHFLGVLHHTQGRVDESVALIRQSLATLPNNAGAWNNLGNVLLTAGRVDEASTAYEQGIAGRTACHRPRSTCGWRRCRGCSRSGRCGTRT